MIMKIRHLFAAAGLGAVIVLAGCTSKETPPTAPPPPTSKAEKGAHGHKPGAHGGQIVELSGDSYHAEVIFEKGGKLRLYTLDSDETKIKEVEARAVTAYAKPDGGEAEAFELKPSPQDGDKPGHTSRFIGQLPAAAAGKAVTVTVTNFRIGDERFQFSFKSAADDSHGDVPMPPKKADEAEKMLYLTPGGKYTADDIKANGGMTASEKFKGLKAKHDMKPKPGDKVCPVTQTKANAKFTWIVGGKAYEFCCPPCVDEFVSTAKEKPEEIKEPDEYRQK